MASTEVTTASWPWVARRESRQPRARHGTARAAEVLHPVDAVGPADRHADANVRVIRAQDVGGMTRALHPRIHHRRRGVESRCDILTPAKSQITGAMDAVIR